MNRRCLTILIVFAVLFSVFTPIRARALTPPEALTSAAAILFEPESGQILFSKNPDELRAPASLTKIATVMTVIRLCPDPDHTTITVPDESLFDDIYAVGGVNIELSQGEQLTAAQLMYAAMLPSACDAASVLAYHFGEGDISAFCARMDAFAAECGATNTHFVNAHGLDAAGHLTTASDLVKILRVALQNETFQKIISTTRYLIPATEYAKPREITYESTIPMLYTYNSNYYEGLRGIKSGTTLNAGCCLSTLCEKNGLTLAVVCLGAGRGENGENLARSEATALLDWGFANFTKVAGIQAGERYATIALTGATESELKLVTRRTVTILKDVSGGALEYDAEIPETLSPPFSDEAVGTLRVTQDGVELLSEPLYPDHVPIEPAKEMPGAENDGSKPDFTLWILIFVIVVLLAVFVLLHRAAYRNLVKNQKKAGRRP